MIQKRINRLSPKKKEMESLRLLQTKHPTREKSRAEGRARRKEEKVNKEEEEEEEDDDDDEQPKTERKRAKKIVESENEKKLINEKILEICSADRASQRQDSMALCCSHELCNHPSFSRLGFLRRHIEN